jgi:hypothetical protein
MTASRIVTIMCDAPKCGVWEDSGIGDTAKQARAQLAGSDWVLGVADPDGRRHLRDYCPQHRDLAPDAS